MNRWGRQAHQHWATWRPNQLSQIEDPQTYFTELGETVETQIEALQIALAGDDPGGETYLQKLGRLRMARFDAEAQVLRELVLLPPESGHPQAEDPDYPTDPEDSEYPEDQGRLRDEDGHLLEPGVIGVTPWMPVVMTPDHPNYHDFDPPEDSTNDGPPTRGASTTTVTPPR
ncbi:MAG: hypothetical protein ACR2N4_03790 [Jatrophihabitans sp.]